MQYMLLIYAVDSAEPAPGTPEFNEHIQAYGVYTQDVQAKGLLKAGDALDTVASATTVRVRDGKTKTTDGPFAETKEQLGGYYILDCKDLDEAIEYAAKIPSAKFGSVEIRPVMIFDE